MTLLSIYSKFAWSSNQKILVSTPVIINRLAANDSREQSTSVRDFKLSLKERYTR